MITKEIIKECVEKGFIRFIVDPNMGQGTVCQIGDRWFCFGGETAEKENPAEFLANADMDEVVRDVCETLDGYRQLPDSPEEYQYYEAFLSGCLKASPGGQENTVLRYRYRDSENFKETVVLSGKMTEAQYQELVSCTDGGAFVPSKAGLPDAHAACNGGIWYELAGYGHTEEPAGHVSVEQLLERFRKAKGKWDTPRPEHIPFLVASLCPPDSGTVRIYAGTEPDWDPNPHIVLDEQQTQWLIKQSYADPEQDGTGRLVAEVEKLEAELERNAPDGPYADADTILADLTDDCDMQFAGVAQDIFNIWKRSRDKDAVEQMFYEFTDMEFMDYLKLCRDTMAEKSK